MPKPTIRKSERERRQREKRWQREQAKRRQKRAAIATVYLIADADRASAT